jgi:hypothetical protein
MTPLIRSILAVVAGLVAANLIMLAVTSVNSVLHPEIVKAVESNDPEALQTAIAAPGSIGALLIVLAAWVLGSLAGGFVGARISQRAAVVHGLIVGGLFMAGGIANNLAYPPPLWFWVATGFAFLPAAYAGARLSVRS